LERCNSRSLLFDVLLENNLHGYLNILEMDLLIDPTIIKPREYLFKDGDPGDCAYIIESGKVEILLDRDGVEVVVATLSKGDIIGELSIIDRLPRIGSARAIVATEVTEIPFDYLSEKIEQSDPTVRMFLRIIMARYRDLNTRLKTVATSLASISVKGELDEPLSTTMELENVTTLYTDLQNRIDSAVTGPSHLNSELAVSEGTLEFAKVMVIEEKLLRKAVENQEFVLHYQPIIELAGNKMVGCEALVRWNHPSGELVPPSLFISQMEKNNLIIDMGYWIAEQACRFQNRVYDEFRYNFFVAINLSGKQFYDQMLVPKLTEIMQRTGARRNRIEFEITESILIESPEFISGALHELKESGAGLALDDFGTGYSGFSNLHQLPFDKLKIDRAFISSMSGGSKSKQIVKSMINMSSDLGMTVVAEGIELRSDVDILREYQATYGQGFYFSRPICEKDFVKLLQS
jgi:diguanylate cyclase